MVRGLDVPVDLARTVGCGDATADVPRNRDRFPPGKGPLSRRNPARFRLSSVRGRCSASRPLRRGRTRRRRYRDSTAPRLGPPGGIGPATRVRRDFPGEQFHRDPAVERRVFGRVDDAHPAPPESAGDGVSHQALDGGRGGFPRAILGIRAVAPRSRGGLRWRTDCILWGNDLRQPASYRAATAEELQDDSDSFSG